MKKCISLFLTTLCFFIVLGCSQKSSSRQPNSTNYQHQEKTFSYQELSKKQKEKIRFSFNVYDDESNKKNNVAAGGVSIVDMKIKNSSNYNVKFDLSKFLISGTENSNNILSNQKKIIKIKPGENKSVSELFSNVADQHFVGAGFICYLNNNNKIAYINSNGKSKFDSNNLKDKKLIKAQKLSDDNVNRNQNDVSDEKSDQTDDQSDVNQSQNNTSGSSVIASAEQANSLLTHSLALAPGVVQTVKVDDGYKVTEPETMQGTIVHYNGDVTSQDGSTDSFDSLKQGTTNDPDGWNSNN